MHLKALLLDKEKGWDEVENPNKNIIYNFSINPQTSPKSSPRERSGQAYKGEDLSPSPY